MGFAQQQQPLPGMQQPPAQLPTKMEFIQSQFGRDTTPSPDVYGGLLRALSGLGTLFEQPYDGKSALPIKESISKVGREGLFSNPSPPKGKY